MEQKSKAEIQAKFTQFNPENKLTLTYGECLIPAMEITDQIDADQYFANYVAYAKRQLQLHPEGNNGMTAEEICRHNLGYFAGYYNIDTRKRVEQLFQCSHPIFGDAGQPGPTVEQALEAGKAAASKMIDKTLALKETLLYYYEGIPGTREEGLLAIYIKGMEDVLNKIMYKIPKDPNPETADDPQSIWRTIAAEASDIPGLPGYFFYNDESGLIEFKHKDKDYIEMF